MIFNEDGILENEKIHKCIKLLNGVVKDILQLAKNEGASPIELHALESHLIGEINVETAFFLAKIRNSKLKKKLEERLKNSNESSNK